MKIALTASAAFLSLALDSHAAEVTVMSGGAIKSAFTAASDAWSKREGHAVRATFAPAGELRRKVAARPDISTPEAFKRILQQAKSLTYMDPTRGTSGKHVDETVLPKLGIRDEVRAKTQFGEGGYIADKVARGEVEIALHQMSEMLPVPGIDIVGPLPKELQKETVYSAVIMKGAKNPRQAEALLAYLVSPEGRKAFLERGFSAP